MIVNTKDIIAGASFLAIGGFVCVYAYTQLDIGTAYVMGPGYFPMTLGMLLCFLGIAIGLSALSIPPSPIGDFAWRAVLLITFATVLFGVGVRGFGLAPVVALTVFLACLASRKTSLLAAVAGTAVLWAVSLLIFYYGLGLSVSLIGPWLAKGN